MMLQIGLIAVSISVSEDWITAGGNNWSANPRTCMRSGGDTASMPPISPKDLLMRSTRITKPNLSGFRIYSRTKTVTGPQAFMTTVKYTLWIMVQAITGRICMAFTVHTYFRVTENRPKYLSTIKLFISKSFSSQFHLLTKKEKYNLQFFLTI